MLRCALPATTQYSSRLVMGACKSFSCNTRGFSTPFYKPGINPTSWFQRQRHFDNALFEQLHFVSSAMGQLDSQSQFMEAEIQFTLEFSKTNSHVGKLNNRTRLLSALSQPERNQGKCQKEWLPNSH